LKIQYTLGFLLLLVATLSSVPFYASYGQTENDKDRDGVPDADDHCPNLIEDYEGEIDGCPSFHKIYHDSDLDGIVDHEDLCPDVRETYNKYQDEDGCPDTPPGEGGGTPDSDGDGIIDILDSCPNQPETYNGILDRDGCPDDYISPYDKDGDGIPDAIDACPNAKETYNMYQDDDGCPDTVVGGGTAFSFPDSDGDGIEDRMNQCPNQPENKNGYCIFNILLKNYPTGVIIKVRNRDVKQMDKTFQFF